jgi:hypothetical protein
LILEVSGMAVVPGGFFLGGERGMAPAVNEVSTCSKDLDDLSFFSSAGEGVMFFVGASLSGRAGKE